MKKDGTIVRYSAQELRDMVARGESLTDWDRVRAKTEEELERDIASDPDWRDLAFDWENAVRVTPGGVEQPLIPIDQDVVQWFRDQGPGYQTRINAVLRAFVQEQTKKRA